MAQKAPSKMNAEECLAELAEQVDAGVEFDTEFNEATPVESLRDLVKIGRKALKDGEAEEGESEEEESEEANDGGEPEASAPAPALEFRDAKILTVVCDPMSKTRDYSEASHGAPWRILAQQYCDHMIYKGIKAQIVAH